MTGYVIPVLFLTVLVASFVRKKDAYGMFVEGSRGAVDLMVSVFPYLLHFTINRVEPITHQGILIRENNGY